MLIRLIWLIRLISAKPAPQHNLNYTYFHQCQVLFSGHQMRICAWRAKWEQTLTSAVFVSRVRWVDRTRGTAAALLRFSQGSEGRGGEETKDRQIRSLRDAGHWECRSLSSSVLSSPQSSARVCMAGDERARCTPRGGQLLTKRKTKAASCPPLYLCLSLILHPPRSLDTYLFLSLFLSLCSLFPPITPRLSLSPPYPAPLCSPCRRRVESRRALH